MVAGRPWFEGLELTADEEGKIEALREAVADAVAVRAPPHSSCRRSCCPVACSPCCMISRSAAFLKSAN
jgi:hypothetical protein